MLIFCRKSADIIKNSDTSTFFLFVGKLLICSSFGVSFSFLASFPKILYWGGVILPLPVCLTYIKKPIWNRVKPGLRRVFSYLLNFCKEDTSSALLDNKEYAKGNKGNNTTKTVSVLSSSNSAVLSEHHNIHSQKYQPLAACIIKLLQQVKEDVGAPGLSYSISVDGEDVMSGGLGFADVENGTYCTDETVMRIASISKSLTSVAAGTVHNL